MEPCFLILPLGLPRGPLLLACKTKDPEKKPVVAWLSGFCLAFLLGDLGVQFVEKKHCTH